LDYTAREEDAGGADALLKHYIGVYDPETGNMEVVEARRMVIRGSVRAHQASAEDQALPSVRPTLFLMIPWLLTSVPEY
jgi:DNA-directed RNA polymerase I subunit RPA49